MEPCACIDCFNKPIHEDTVLATRKQIESRNPLAFAPKVIRGSDSPLEIGVSSSVLWKLVFHSLKFARAHGPLCEFDV